MRLVPLRAHPQKWYQNVRLDPGSLIIIQRRKTQETVGCQRAADGLTDIEAPNRAGELTANGNVEAKVVCLFRRRDISGNLNTLADSNANEQPAGAADQNTAAVIGGSQRKSGILHQVTIVVTGTVEIPADVHLTNKTSYWTVQPPAGAVGGASEELVLNVPQPCDHQSTVRPRWSFILTSLKTKSLLSGEFEEESKQPALSEQQKHQLKHRELFLSRQFESLPATHIRYGFMWSQQFNTEGKHILTRNTHIQSNSSLETVGSVNWGKCNVTLLNETDVLAGYLEKEDCFFYSLVFDPVQKTLLADQGEIRVGSKYQAEIPDKLTEDEVDTRVQEKMETKVWDPSNQLKDAQIDQFLVVARTCPTPPGWWNVGTRPSSEAFRDVQSDSDLALTQLAQLVSWMDGCPASIHASETGSIHPVSEFHAMDTLQKNNYDLARAMSTLVPQGGPVLCRDEMEEWSASEAMLFEEALEKYGKDFNDIRQDFVSSPVCSLPWKSLASVVQFYYMWKTTDRYIQQVCLQLVTQQNDT
ncbi:hypothetical protein CCH79_00014458 [Gambusia affinis]|uniref:SANT domain-containing protein n=1 Tax=Gambusia affinis TaxID=33528 RepID=A0A315USP6_GAMAF|nr:hypothetical protein CCH79_00014458 [Gambusia affinis]